MSNAESLYNGPFCEPPVDAGMREGRLYVLPSHPELVIRPSFQEHTPPSAYPYDERRAEMAQYRSALDVLRDEHGLPNPVAYHVVGPSIYDPVRVTDYVVTHRVHGIDVEDNLAEVPAAAAYGALANIVNYYAGVVLRGGTYISDIDLRQCKYGVTAQHPQEKRIRLVDLDETVLEYPRDTAERDGTAEDLNETLRLLGDQAARLENVHGQTYPALRWRIVRLMGILHERHPSV